MWLQWTNETTNVGIKVDDQQADSSLFPKWRDYSELVKPPMLAYK